MLQALCMAELANYVLDPSNMLQKVEIAFQRTRESGISSVKARCQSPGGCKSKRRIWFLSVVSMHRSSLLSLTPTRF